MVTKLFEENSECGDTIANEAEFFLPTIKCYFS
jgi:hypothetical protein